jgi:large subunit ribosomal protein L4
MEKWVMPSLSVYNQQGKSVGTYDIEPTDLAPSINRQLLHDVVVMYQNNLRQGSNKTKTRSEVAGTTRKMYRQKGTGNARAGSRRSGIRRGGGHIHARQPRDYSYRLPRKAVQLATRMAIASKIHDGEIVVLDELTLNQPTTRTMAGILKALNLNGVTTLVTVPTYDVNVYKSARNIAGVTVAPVSSLNAIEVLRPSRMLVTRAALDAIRALKKSSAKSSTEEN